MWNNNLVFLTSPNKFENDLIYHPLKCKRFYLESVLQMQPKYDIHFLSRVLTQTAFPVCSLVLQLFLTVFQELVTGVTSSSLLNFSIVHNCVS